MTRPSNQISQIQVDGISYWAEKRALFYFQQHQFHPRYYDTRYDSSLPLPLLREKVISETRVWQLLK
jgi:hypothetical protein